MAVGETQPVTFNLSSSSLWLMGGDGRMGLLKGVYLLQVGGAGPGSRGEVVDGGDVGEGTVRVGYPGGVEGAVVCEEGLKWWGEHARGLEGEEGQAGLDGGKAGRTALVDVPFSIVGGVSAVLTVC